MPPLLHGAKAPCRIDKVRIVIKEGVEGRLSDSLETALKLADGIVMVDVIDWLQPLSFTNRALIFRHIVFYFLSGIIWTCFTVTPCQVRNHTFIKAGMCLSIGEINPRMFSFNNPYGACPACDGLGSKMEIDPALSSSSRISPSTRTRT